MLRRMRIRSKLFAIVVAPIVALIVLAGSGLRTRIDDGQKANQVRRFAVLAAAVRPVTQRLADERALSVQFLVAKTDTTPDALTAARTQLDQAITKLRAATKRSGAVPPKLAEHLGAAEADFLLVKQTRGQLDAGAVNADHVVQNYSSAVDHLLDFIDEFGNIPELSDAAITRATQAAAEVGVAREGYAIERDLVVSALSAGSLTIEQYGTLRARQQQVADQIRRFKHDASPAAAKAITDLETKVSMAPANEMEQAAANSGPYAPLVGSPSDYAVLATQRTTALTTIENQASNAVLTAARAKATASRAAERNYLAGTLGALAVALGLAVLVARSLVRPIRELTQAATDAAEVHLPRLVEAIHSADAVNGSATDFALPPIAVRSKDEIGGLARAFNAVQDVTIRTAIEQINLRRSVGDMFVNLGRRSQTLVDRQLELIDSLETAERDPDALNDLFALDHLATRMRRNAENLLVLAGEEAPRKWGQAIPLVDVIRAAVSEVEDYPRVDVVAQDELFLAGHAASDIAHLLAELIENATSFSAPTTRVRVRVEQAGERCLVSVVDQGIGMSDTDLANVNERLANPPEADFSLGNRIGFFVIGRLAKRTGTAVRLGRSSSSGVIAQLALPPTLVTANAGELLSPTSMPQGPLLDSPQSARDRLIGALRTQPTAGPDSGPDSAVTAPAAHDGPVSITAANRSNPPTPITASMRPASVPPADETAAGNRSSTRTGEADLGVLPKRRNGRAGRTQPAGDPAGDVPTLGGPADPASFDESPVRAVEPVSSRATDALAPLPSRRANRAAEPAAVPPFALEPIARADAGLDTGQDTQPAATGRRNLGAFFGAGSAAQRDVASSPDLVPPSTDPSAPAPGLWAAPGIAAAPPQPMAEPAAASFAPMPPVAPVIPERTSAPLTSALDERSWPTGLGLSTPAPMSAPVPAPVAAPTPAAHAPAAALNPTVATPLPSRVVPPSPTTAVPPAPTFSPMSGGVGFGTPGGMASGDGLDERLAASSGLSSLLGQARVTPAGLPQRAAGATRRTVPGPAPVPDEPHGRGARSADDVRSMLSRFRGGVERGRHLPEPTAARSTED